MSLRLRDQFFESSRGRIVDQLRRGGLTVDELTAALALTGNAVRVQLASMERDGLVRRGAMRRGPTRPASVYELTPELEQLLSRAYVPLLTQLIRACAEREPPEAFDTLMREAALTGKHPGVCHAIESLLTELLQARVRECCDREARPRCCFHISPA